MVQYIISPWEGGCLKVLGLLGEVVRLIFMVIAMLLFRKGGVGIKLLNSSGMVSHFILSTFSPSRSYSVVGEMTDDRHAVK